MLNALFGFGGIANAGLMAKQGYNVRSRNTTRRAPMEPQNVLYNDPAEFESLKKQWTINESTYDILQGIDTDDLDELFKEYLKTKKIISIKFSKKKITKEKFNVIDKASSQYLDMIKTVMKEKATMLLAGKSEGELRDLIGQINKRIAQASIDATKVPNDKRLDLIVDKEYLQFMLSIIKDVLQLKKNNKYVASSMEAPALNMSYLNERNFSLDGRKGLNTNILQSSAGRNKNLTEKQINARRIVAMKMARGEPVTMEEKYHAGMVTIPKPSMPKPSMPQPSMTQYPKPSYPKPSMPKPTGPKPIATSVGGRKTRRNRKH